MSEKINFEVTEPQYSFWEVCVSINTEDAETHKAKKTKEIHLVDGINPEEINQKVAEYMKNMIWEWEIVSCKKSKINMVY